MSPKVSVIVPVYKAEAYLHRCVDSILAQTFQDFEVLLIDDGSPDKSGEICDEYARKDNRVRVFHQTNYGVTAARATGVGNVSSSEYITFVDADDTLPSSAINDLYLSANSDCDIIIGNFDRNYKTYSTVIVDSLSYSKLLLSGKIHYAPWARLFKRTLFENDEIFNVSRDIKVGEDLLMNLRLSFLNKKNVKIISSIVYCYNDIATSTMNNFTYTMNYLEHLYEIEKSIIPVHLKQECMSSYIEGVLTRKNYIIEYYFYENLWRKTNFHKSLLADIKEYSYKLSPYMGISLFFSNPLYSLIHIFLRSAFNIIRGMRIKMFKLITNDMKLVKY